MRRPRWFFYAFAAATVLALALIAGGGIYRTVNAGAGVVYVVNRFTARTYILQNGAREAVGSADARAAREKRKAESERGRRVWQSLHTIAENLDIRSASVVGDPASKVYHMLPPLTQLALRDTYWLDKEDRPSPTFIGPSETGLPQVEKLFARKDWPSAMGVCPALPSVATPLYFSSELEATKAGYWPCSKCCLQIFTFPKTQTPVRDWPRPEAPVSYMLPKKKLVCLLAKHGDFYGVGSEQVASGERFMGWVQASHVKVQRCPICKGSGMLGTSQNPQGVCYFCRGYGQAGDLKP